jgi:hypothetical protein
VRSTTPAPRDRTSARRATHRRPAPCPNLEIARLGRTLRQWRTQILARFATGGVNNSCTEAISGIIEKARRLAHGFRNFDNNRLRILLAADGIRPYRQPPGGEDPACRLPSVRCRVVAVDVGSVRRANFSWAALDLPDGRLGGVVGDHPDAGAAAAQRPPEGVPLTGRRTPSAGNG